MQVFYSYGAGASIRSSSQIGSGKRFNWWTSFVSSLRRTRGDSTLLVGRVKFTPVELGNGSRTHELEAELTLGKVISAVAQTCNVPDEMSQKLISTPPVGMKLARNPLSLRGTKAEKNATADPAMLTLMPGTTSTMSACKLVVTGWELMTFPC